MPATTLFSPMTSSQYAKTLARLDLAHRGIGSMFGLSPRTSRMYASGELKVTPLIALTLRLLEEHVPSDALEQFRYRRR
jgi:hypothetical protein